MKYILTLVLLVLMVGCCRSHKPPSKDQTTVEILNKETEQVVKVIEDVREVEEGG